MANTEKKTSYLIDNIDRELWKKVRDAAYTEGVSIKKWLINLIKEKVNAK